jgi:hypothetical protein
LRFCVVYNMISTAEVSDTLKWSFNVLSKRLEKTFVKQCQNLEVALLKQLSSAVLYIVKQSNTILVDVST